jgi:hypothetical protein
LTGWSKRAGPGRSRVRRTSRPIRQAADTSSLLLWSDSSSRRVLAAHRDCASDGFWL